MGVVFYSSGLHGTDYLYCTADGLQSCYELLQLGYYISCRSLLVWTIIKGCLQRIPIILIPVLLP